MTTDPSEERRLTAVEESAGFAEHKAEQLESMVTDLSTELFELRARVEHLEQRLIALEAGDRGEPDAADTEPPPHAHRPL